jgi:hypothetical protein
MHPTLKGWGDGTLSPNQNTKYVQPINENYVKNKENIQNSFT